MEILITKNIIKTYHSNNIYINAINAINLSITNGEFIGIMGPSGSGKTTLLNLLSGLDKPTQGEIDIEGIKIDSLNNDALAIFRRQKLGFIFQDFNLLDSLTIKENIILPMTLMKKPEHIVDKKAVELMKLLEIFDIANKYPFQTSGGQQQRAAIGRALANDPVIVFADEPTGNLDSRSSNTIMDYFEKINNEKQCTILMVTHDAYAASFCKRIIFIKDGFINSEMVKDCSRKEFYDKLLIHLIKIGDSINDVQ